jgi:chaperonin GroES
MNLKPLGDRLIIESIEKDEMTPTGIYVPETAKEKPQEGLVLAAGPGRLNEETGKRAPLDVAVGDRVIYQKYAGTEIKLENKKYLILSEKDILAVVVGEAQPA